MTSRIKFARPRLMKADTLNVSRARYDYGCEGCGKTITKGTTYATQENGRYHKQCSHYPKSFVWDGEK